MCTRTRDAGTAWRGDEPILVGKWRCLSALKAARTDYVCVSVSGISIIARPGWHAVMKAYLAPKSGFAFTTAAKRRYYQQEFNYKRGDTVMRDCRRQGYAYADYRTTSGSISKNTWWYFFLSIPL